MVINMILGIDSTDSFRQYRYSNMHKYTWDNKAGFSYNGTS